MRCWLSSNSQRSGRRLRRSRTPHGASPVLIICEHASRTLPESFGDLGLSHEALSSHIAWDPGALAVARGMSASLDATLVYQRFSRLIYDCNRPPEVARRHAGDQRDLRRSPATRT